MQLVVLLLCLCLSRAVRAGEQNSQRLCHRGLTTTINAGALTENDTVVYRNVSYPKGKYYSEATGTEMRGCICEVVPHCVRKCCPWGQTLQNSKCKPSKNSLPFDFQPSVFEGEQLANVSTKDYFTVFVNDYCSDGSHMVWPNDPHFLQTSGTLYMPESSYLFLKSQLFCFERNEDRNEITILICNGPPQTLYSKILAIAMILTLPFIMTTFLVFACIPEMRNLHGKSIMSYIAALFIAYLFIFTANFAKRYTVYCTIIPFIIYFSFVASFFWLNVLAIDIWWTFSGLRGFDNMIESSEKKRFLIYSMYAWGLSLTLLIVVLIMQYLPNLPRHLIKPRIGIERCFFSNQKAITFYFYSPIIFVIVVNSVLFSYTLFKIWSIQRNTDKSMTSESRVHKKGGYQNEKQRFKLYLKLVGAFGVNWLWEIISWFGKGPEWCWYVTDLFNVSYPIFIFYIFICKSNVWKLIQKRYCAIIKSPNTSSTITLTGSVDAMNAQKNQTAL